MKIKKAKGAYYVQLKLDPEARRYLRDYNKYESKSNIKGAERFLNLCVAQHIRALYFMNFAKLLAADGQIKKKEFQPMVNELQKVMDQYGRILDRGIAQLRKKKVE